MLRKLLRTSCQLITSSRNDDTIYALATGVNCAVSVIVQLSMIDHQDRRQLCIPCTLAPPKREQEHQLPNNQIKNIGIT